MKDPQSIRIVFFGTPDFAAFQMEHLLKQGYHVVGAVTAPDKPAGRGKKISSSALKQKALQYQVPLLQPEKLRDPIFLEQLDALRGDLYIVIAFRMLPAAVWQKPPLGTFNLHASLLPQYRGAAPINRAIMNGETETGLTTFFINDAIDTGNILLQKTMFIDEDETAGELHDRMVEEGKILIEETIIAIARGNIHTIAQQATTENLKGAPKIFRSDCKIDWRKSGIEIHNFVRGLSPYPAAHTIMEDENGKQEAFKVLKGKYELGNDSKNDLFSLLTDNRTFLKVALAEGYYYLLEIQFPGKKAMDIKEFLRGNSFAGKWQLK